MSEETELPKALSDPTNTFLDLNEYMLDGIDHLRYVLGYSLWFGALISIASIGAFGWHLVEDGLSWLHLVLAPFSGLHLARLAREISYRNLASTDGPER